VGELGIILLKASLERKRSKLEIFLSQSLYRGGELRIFPSPRAHIGGRERSELEIFPTPKAYIGGGQSLRKNEEIWGKYDEIGRNVGLRRVPGLPAGEENLAPTKFLGWPPVPKGKAGPFGEDRLR